MEFTKYTQNTKIMALDKQKRPLKENKKYDEWENRKSRLLRK